MPVLVEEQGVTTAPEMQARKAGRGFKPRTARKRRNTQLRNILVYAALPALIVVLACAAGYLNWLTWSQSQTALAGPEAVRAASDATVAMLSYRPDTVQNDLDAAKERLTGSFRESYTSLVDDVVAPAAIQKLISSDATVPAASVVSATQNHAVVLLFVNQNVSIGNNPPTATTSSVRAILDKVDGRWLVAEFGPI